VLVTHPAGLIQAQMVVPVNLSHDVVPTLRVEALRVRSKIVIHSVEIQSVDMFGARTKRQSAVVSACILHLLTHTACWYPTAASVL
jgi:hypothetical protein